jgi:ribosome biogenesis GTPase
LLAGSFSCLEDFGWDARVVARYAAIDPSNSLLPGRVVRVERSSCVVALGARDVAASAPLLPAVGDWVAVELVESAAIVRGCVERWSVLARQDPDLPRAHVLAANIDLTIITAPADRPSPSRVEREVVLGWDSGAVPLVVVTKCDLDDGRYAEALRERVVGVDVVAASSVTGAGIEIVRESLRPHRTAVLLGPSGAGKSTLANALLESERLATGAVRDEDQRGRHTTTWRELVVVPSGGVLIDTPGLRSLGMVADADALGAAFRDVEELATQCRFGDCAHQREPGCAVQAAVDRGELDAARLTSYRKLQREIAFEARRSDPIARAEDLRRWKSVRKEVRARTRHRPGHQ